MSKLRLFGTDGLRGEVGTGVLTPIGAHRLGQALGLWVRQQTAAAPCVVVGRDTRQSGPVLTAALQAGLQEVGVNVIDLGVLPTAAVGRHTQWQQALAGVMVTASHNPYTDNGFKLFGADGDKLADTALTQLEDFLLADNPVVMSAAVTGQARRLTTAATTYQDHLRQNLPTALSLHGYRLVVDCANGAQSDIAPHLLQQLGAEVYPLHVQPDGQNINHACGALYPAALQAAVVAQQADLGLAFDGDADRLQLVDANGHLIDGDQIMAAIVKAWHDQGQYHGGLVGTVMTNQALEVFVQQMGYGFVRTDVGDPKVVKELRTRGWPLGGEPNGHIIFGDQAGCGDALLAALHFLQVMRYRGQSAATIGHTLQLLPAATQNLRLAPGQNARAVMEHPDVIAALATAQAALAGVGRLVARPSGTEPLIRLTVEAQTTAQCQAVLSALSHTVQAALRH